MAEGGRGIQSVEVSGRILRAIIKSGDRMMLKELAEAADLKAAQCHAYLTSLKNVGLVHQDWATGLYSAGPFALRLGVSWLEGDPGISFAIREMKAFSEEYGVLSLVTVWGTFGPTIIHMYAGPNQAALNLRQGSLFSVTGTATGRVFAAFDTNPKVSEQIEAELSHRAGSLSIGETVSREDFDSLTADIRKLGYATAFEKPIPGVNAISVPIFGKDGHLSFVATLIGASDRLCTQADSPSLSRMLNLAQNLSLDELTAESDLV